MSDTPKKNPPRKCKSKSGKSGKSGRPKRSKKDDLEPEIPGLEEEDPDYESPESPGSSETSDSEPDDDDLLALFIEPDDYTDYTDYTKSRPINKKITKQEIDNHIKAQLLAEDYEGFEPGDTHWMVGLPLKEIKDTQNKLKAIRNLQKEKEITIPKILNLPVTDLVKADLLEKYDLLMNLPRFTPTFIEMREKLQERIKFVVSTTSATPPPAPQQDDRTIIVRIPARRREDPADRTDQDSQNSQNSQKAELIKQLREHAVMRKSNKVDEILKLDAPIHIKSKLLSMFERTQTLTNSDSERVEEYLRWALALPYNKIIDPYLPQGGDLANYCQQIRAGLDEYLYGMADVKEQLLSILVQRITNPQTTGLLIALEGPPGTGKTSIAQALAKVLKIPFGKLSLGGVADVTNIKGSNSMWVGAQPGMFVKIMAEAKCSNPIIFIDEIDKVGDTPHGKEVQYSFLHITDPSSNSEFQDSYLGDIPLDLSRVWFIIALNDRSQIDPTLADRMNYIVVPSYSKEEKKHIVSKYILPKHLKNIGKDQTFVQFDESGLDSLIELVPDEGGIRPIERLVKNIVSKLNMIYAITGSIDKIINREMVMKLHINNMVRSNNSYQMMYL